SWCLGWCSPRPGLLCRFSFLLGLTARSATFRRRIDEWAVMVRKVRVREFATVGFTKNVSSPSGAAEEHPMNQAPTEHQLRYVRRLISEAHSAGVPYLPIERLNREAVSAWIEYLEIVVRV